ncbi:MAG: PKD domain-containing protein [Patescibacteria group bacterium]
MEDRTTTTSLDKIVAPSAATPSVPGGPGKTPTPRKPVNPKKLAFGCLGLLFGIIAILIIAMAFGMNAREETIISLGLNPVSLKNWTIGLISIFFGTFALTSIIAFVFNLSRRLLVAKDDSIGKSKSLEHTIASGLIFVAVIGVWFVVYDYFSQFKMTETELPVEIVTNPASTFDLTSPVRIDFSAERITAKYEKIYDIVSYEWDKEGDGGVDTTGPKVTIYFPNGGKNNGVYNVNLLVKMQPKAGGDIVTQQYQKQVSISKQEIYGEIGVDKESGEVPLTVKFDANNITDPNGAKITNYTWDLDNDGRPDRDGPSYGKTEWTFDTIGEHTIKLTVTSADFNPDGTHETKSFEKKITVREPAGSVKSEIWIEAKPSKGFAPLTVNFAAKQKSTEIVLPRVEKYEWQIGDGLATLWGQNAHYTFEKTGNYPIALTVTFANGQVAKATEEIVVNDESFSPTAVIVTEPTINQMQKAVSGPAPLTVKFDGSKSKDPDDNIVKYEWDFDGDGLWDAESNLASYQFIKAGNYKTTLRVTDADGNESRATVAVVVGEEKAIVDFGADRVAGPAPLTVNFDASGSYVPTGKKITSYEWNFNSQNTNGKQTFIYDRAQTSHVFGAIGEYPVKLTLHTNDGEEYSGTLKIVVANASLVADFTLSRTSGSAPLAISFDATKSSGSIARVEWDFGDDSTSLDKKPTHIFEKAGRYEIVLKIYDTFGNISQTSKIVTVN